MDQAASSRVGCCASFLVCGDACQERRVDTLAGPRPVTSTAALVAAVAAFTPLPGQPGHPGWLEAITAWP